MAREGQAATGLPGGLAIPHCRSAAVTEASLAFARLNPKVDFGAPDGPAELVFLIAAPAEGDADHLTLLTALARALVRPDFVAVAAVGHLGRGDRGPRAGRGRPGAGGRAGAPAAGARRRRRDRRADRAPARASSS